MSDYYIRRLIEELRKDVMASLEAIHQRLESFEAPKAPIEKPTGTQVPQRPTPKSSTATK